MREPAADRQADRADQRSGWRAWLAVARERATVLRALKFAAVVGSILIAINHGDALLAGDLGTRRLLKMGLTVLVPYTVSTLSSVGATLAARRG
jgi:hypothetical protein